MRIFSNLLPHVFAKAAGRIRTLRRIGMSGFEASCCVLDSRAWRNILEARLDLLPDSFASHVGIVVDVGANRGDWSGIAWRILKPQKLIAIEPNPTLYTGIVERFKAHTAITCLNLGAGSKSGELPFYITSGSQCASFLKPERKMLDIYGDLFAEEKTIAVKVEPLDEILRDYEKISLLKIDVQGYERELLLGAVETLRKTDYVLVEVNFVSHYQNDIQFPELDRIMSSHGFMLANLSQPFIKQERVLWADALYKKMIFSE